jgi:hypothetical protein
VFPPCERNVNDERSVNNTSPFDDASTAAGLPTSSTGYRGRMGTDHHSFDAAFDAAFAHLTECRIAYEDDPRDPALFAALGAARAALEDARIHMTAERSRLGLEPRTVHIPPAGRADAEDRETWQGTYGD